MLFYQILSFLLFCYGHALPHVMTILHSMQKVSLVSQVHKLFFLLKDIIL